MGFLRRTTMMAIVCALTACGGEEPTNSSTTDTGQEQDMGPTDAGDSGSQQDDVAAEPDLPGDETDDMSSPPGFADPAAESGSRLQVRYMEAGAGAYLTTDFWDTELETSCSFSAAADGSQRCLPNVTREISFADSDCTEPVLTVAETDCDSIWAKDGEASTYYRGTQTPAVLSGSLYVNGTYGCERTEFDPEDEHWVAELAPPGQFVGGTAEDVTRTDDMVARYIDGSDGSRVLLEVLHRTRGYTCEFDEEGRCLPSARTAKSFLDSACTDPIYSYDGDSPPPMLADVSLNAENCVQGRQYYETGARVTPDVRYYLADGVCTAIDFSMSNYYRPGAPITLDSLPRASFQLEGEAELQARRRVDQNGEALDSAHTFWDTTRDETCSPMLLADEQSAVCLADGSALVSSTLHTDASCTEPIAIAFTCRTSDPRLAADRGEQSCNVSQFQTLLAAYERGAEVGPDIYRRPLRSSDCDPGALGQGRDGYRLGAEVTGELPNLEFKTDSPHDTP